LERFASRTRIERGGREDRYAIARGRIDALGVDLDFEPLGLVPGQFDLRVSATHHNVDFAREDVDAAIRGLPSSLLTSRHGDRTAPGLEVTLLCTEELFPVCSPKFLRGRHALRRPSDLAHHSLLHLDHRQDWSKWLDAAGVDDADLSRGPVLN
jgi:LysR family glycine cleavage system transcriptional activator